MDLQGNGTSTELVMIGEGILNNIAAIAAGDYQCLAIKEDGTVYAWGDNHGGMAIGAETPESERAHGIVKIGDRVLTNVVSIAAGDSFSLALKHDGKVVAWGRNVVPAGLSNIVAIAARGVYSFSA